MKTIKNIKLSLKVLSLFIMFFTININSSNIASTLTLYYFPGVGSLATRILAKKLDIKLKYNKVDLIGNKKTADGMDYQKINPLGYVPALIMNDNSILTESPAILQYLADIYGYGKIIPKINNKDRYNG